MPIMVMIIIIIIIFISDQVIYVLHLLRFYFVQFCWTQSDHFVGQFHLGSDENPEDEKWHGMTIFATINKMHGYFIHFNYIVNFVVIGDSYAVNGECLNFGSIGSGRRTSSSVFRICDKYS